MTEPSTALQHLGGRIEGKNALMQHAESARETYLPTTVLAYY